MVANSKQDFSSRLDQACDNAIPPIPKGRGRRAELQRRVQAAGLKVSGESVRKWLSAESIPSMDNLRFIAIALRVDTDWLLTGRKISQYSKNQFTELPAKQNDLPAFVDSNTTIHQVVMIMKALNDLEQEKILAYSTALRDMAKHEQKKSIKRTG